MKNKAFVLLCGLSLLFFALSSCVSSNLPKQKRKRCKGKGGWYNNRNVELIQPQVKAWT